MAPEDRLSRTPDVLQASIHAGKTAMHNKAQLFSTFPSGQYYPMFSAGASGGVRRHHAGKNRPSNTNTLISALSVTPQSFLSHAAFIVVHLWRRRR